MSNHSHFPYLQVIEQWLIATDSSASGLSNTATGSPNYISMMRLGKPVSKPHVKSIIECMQKYPDGIARKPKGKSTGAKKKAQRIDGAGGPPSSGIPVIGPSNMDEPSLFYSIKSEAFRRGISIAHLMEELLKVGWQQYNQRKAA